MWRATEHKRRSLGVLYAGLCGLQMFVLAAGLWVAWHIESTSWRLLAYTLLGVVLVLPAAAYACRLTRELRGLKQTLQVNPEALEQRVEERTAELRAEIEEGRRVERFDRCRNRILEMVAQGASVEEVLTELALTAEAFCPPSQCFIVTAEEEMLIAPGLSRRCLAALEPVLVGGKNPAALAQSNSQPVVMIDLEQSLPAPAGSELAQQHNIGAWWSTPFVGAEEKVLGSISLLQNERRGPDSREMDTIAALARLATMAIIHAEMQNELFHRAHHDSLTQLPNRSLCDERTSEAIARACRHQRKVGMLCVDLDEFKQINDIYGHEAGDFLLQTIAVRLIGRLRTTDTLARLGGDEFLVVLDDIRDGEDLERVAEALRTAIAEPVRFKNSMLRITASIGGAIYPADGNTPEEIKRHADHAMYRAKERGRNAFQMFSVELSERLARRRQLEGYLRDALDNNGFELYYQPQYTVKRELIGLEALLRFRPAELKSISPAEFIPVAEQTGIILEVGDWVIRDVCRQGKDWLDKGYPPLRISVNISALELAQDRFADRVADAIQRSGFDAKYLQIEVTETAVMGNLEDASRHLRRLEQLGVAVSVDDFGTGHSSLSYLHRLPIDSIKVDRSFVQQITQSDESAAIVRAIVAMASSLDLQVIAEGVETEDQLEAVAKLGCQFIQGYVFSRPLNLSSMPGILTQAHSQPVTVASFKFPAESSRVH